MPASNARHRFRALVALLMCAAAAADPASAQAGQQAATGTVNRPVLLELFTSQGCSSCPPADAVLRALSSRRDVLALGFHVDYWDALGWVDPFASPAFTARQHAYARQHGFQVYTPQLVVDGATALIGSRRGQAEDEIIAAAAAAARRQEASATISRDGRRVRVSLGTTAQAGAAGAVWLISFDRERATEIRSGENAGKRIVYSNVVRSIRKLADWSNTPLLLDERLAADERGERLALVVQGPGGTVWAVAATD